MKSKFWYKRIILYSLTLFFMILSFIEFIKYLFVQTNIFGLIYLIINLLIIFLLIPCSYNYKKYFSKARISKLIIIIFIGVFNSYILEFVVINSINYIDSSKEYINKIFVIKDVLKGIIYLLLSVFTIMEFKLEKLFK